MKKIFAIFVSVLFFASLSLAVVGCKKAKNKNQQRLRKLKHPLLHRHLLQQLYLLHPQQQQHPQHRQHRQHRQNNCLITFLQDNNRATLFKWLLGFFVASMYCFKKKS